MGAFFARLRGGGGSSDPPAGPSRVSEQDRAILVRERPVVCFISNYIPNSNLRDKEMN